MRTITTLALLLLVPTSAPPVRWHHPHDIIDCVELSPTFAQDHTLFATSDGTLNIVGRSNNGGFTWSDVRSGLTGKHVYAMVLANDFGKSGRAYAALGGDGIATTADHGSTWRVVAAKADYRFLAALPFSGIEIPTLFAGTTKGLLRCADPEQPWVELDPDRFRATPPTAVSVARGADGFWTVFVASGDGKLHRSDDGGSAWTTLAQTGDIRRIAPSPQYAKDKSLWLASFGGGVLESHDAGATFAPRNEGLTDLFVNDVAVPARWPECRELFAATKDAGLFRSKDGGAAWELTSLVVEKTYQTDNHHRYVRLPADYPASPQIFCGTFEGLHFSIDGGATWIKANMNPTRFGRRIVLSPDYANDRTVFASGYGMLLSTSSDAGTSWQFGARGVRAMSSYALAVAPTWKDEGLLFLGINEGTWRSTDRGATWKKLEMPPFKRPEGPRQDHDITQVVFSPQFATDRTCYGISFGGVYVSKDAGETFRCLPSPVRYSIEIALSPDFPRDRTLFVGGSRLARSTDGGETFGGDLVEYPVNGVVFAPDWSTTGEVYGWSGFVGFVRSSDRGAKWQISNGGLGGHRPTCVRVDPQFAKNGTLYMTTFGGGLFRSTDRGRSWKRHGSREPRLDHCTTLALSPAFADDHTLFVGNLEGIWRSTDGGENFTLVTTRELYDQMREPWLHTGKWNRPNRTGAFGGMVDVARRAGNTISLPFVGNGVRLFGTRGPDHGKAEIVLDQKVVATIDAYGATAQDSTPLWEDFHLPWGYHVVTVRVLGQKSAASTDVVIGVDAAEVACVGPEGDVPVFSTR